MSHDAVARLASRLADLGTLGEQPAWSRASASFDHVGAKLTDATLQAAVDYEAIVRPRVLRIVATYPQASTSSAFAQVLASEGSAAVLGVSNARKNRTIIEITTLLIAQGVETVPDLRSWLTVPSNEPTLDAVYGVGAKTISFLKLLVGLPAIAVDIHIRRFVASAGVHSKDSREIESLLIAAGAIHSLTAEEVDQLVWRSMAGTAPNRRLRSAAS